MTIQIWLIGAAVSWLVLVVLAVIVALLSGMDWARVKAMILDVNPLNELRKIPVYAIMWPIIFIVSIVSLIHSFIELKRLQKDIRD